MLVCEQIIFFYFLQYIMHVVIFSFFSAFTLYPTNIGLCYSRPLPHIMVWSRSRTSPTLMSHSVPCNYGPSSFLFYIRSHDTTHRTSYFLVTCPSALNKFSKCFLQLMQHSIFPLFLFDDFTQKYLRPIILISTTLVQYSIVLYNAQLSILYNIFGLTLITPLHFPCPHLVLFITCSSTIRYNLS